MVTSHHFAKTSGKAVTLLIPEENYAAVCSEGILLRGEKEPINQNEILMITM